ncbi:2-dehydropantoate 2-reductase N-terminal domain-containing protein [Bradyrhizobium erythrophlei]|uniref:2-dehydropantoate 2-reductase N-terminal domain-containing protein n=1 Tax=Bradyrhizobium erythrophlei TaxID=1437360 RepID=UPI0035ECBF54
MDYADRPPRTRNAVAAYLIGRRMHVDAINTNGLLLDAQIFQGCLPAKAATDACSLASPDLVLLCVKSADSLGSRRLNRLPPCMRWARNGFMRCKSEMGPDPEVAKRLFTNFPIGNQRVRPRARRPLPQGFAWRPRTQANSIAPATY